MDEAQIEDVQQPEVVETGDTSSSVDENTAVDGNSQIEGVEAAEPELKTVPYDRFSQVNAERSEYKQTLAQVQQELAALRQAQQQALAPQADPAQVQEKEVIKQQLAPLLEEMGYVSKAELQRREADVRLEQTLSSLESKYSGKDGSPKFERQAVINYAVANGINNPEAAYKLMNMDALMNSVAQKAVMNSRGIKTEGSNGSGVQNVGTTNDDLKQAIAKGDSSAKSLLFKRLAKQALSNS